MATAEYESKDSKPFHHPEETTSQTEGSKSIHSEHVETRDSEADDWGIEHFEAADSKANNPETDSDSVTNKDSALFEIRIASGSSAEEDDGMTLIR